MTATERLRQLLDERGVEWEGEEANSILHDGKFLYTYWCKGMHCFTEPIGAKEGTLGALTDFSASGFTPEQAVEATLGRGTCHDVAIEGEWFECSECGTVKQLIHPNYCPRCGREVKA